MKKIDLMLVAAFACGMTVIYGCEEQTPELSSVVLSQSEITLEVGMTATLTYELQPEGVEYQTIEWSSSDESVAVVEDGTVTAVSPGEAVITLAVDNLTGECLVTVAPPAVESVELNETEVVMSEEDTLRLVAAVLPVEAAEYASLTWSTSDEEVVTVSVDGMVTAVSAGEAVVTVSCGEISAQCAITVNELPVYAVGDVFEVDGKQGVVVYVDESGKHGKVFSMTSCPYETGIWSTSGILIGASSETDGRANTEAIRNAEGYPDAFPAYKWLDENYGGDWYFPAKILHYKGESTHKSSFRYVHVFYEAMLIFFRKHYGHLSFWLSIPIKTAIYLKATLALVQMSSAYIRKMLGFTVRRSMHNPRYVFLGSAGSLAGCRRIAARCGLDAEYHECDEASNAAGHAAFGITADASTPVYVVYDVSAYKYDTILGIFSAHSQDNVFIGTYNPASDIIITDREIIS